MPSVFAIILFMLCTTWAIPGNANGSADIALGRALFEGRRHFTSAPQVTNVALPRSSAYCAACHGSHGQGRTEAGVKIPAIQWSSLTNSRANLPAYLSADRVLAAIEWGIARSDKATLSNSMPRYLLTADERKALLAYLGVIGTESAPVRGIKPDLVVIGTALPLTGKESSAGIAALMAMRKRVDDINAGGGIYGRKVELKSADSARDGVEQAMKDLIQTQEVFALVGSFLADSSESLTQSLDAANTPSVGAIGMAITKQQHRLTTYLLPSVQQQLELATNILKTRCDSRQRVEVWHSGGKGFEKLLPQVLLSTQVSVADSGTARFFQVTNIEQQFRDSIKSNSADKLVMLFNPGKTNEFYARSDINSYCIATLAVISGVPHKLPQGGRHVVVFPVPQSAVGNSDLWTVLGSAAIGVFAEAMARTGRLLDHERLIGAVDNLRDFEPVPGFKLNFAPDARHGIGNGFVSQ